MANEYAHTTWTLDTAGEVVAKRQRVRIRRMEWVPNAADDDLEVLDLNEENIWVTKALTGGTAGRESIDFGDGKDFIGFDLETIDGGTLYVYLA